MHTVLIVVQVLVAITLIGLVLIQHGKGADAGAAFGSGASGTVFGSRGAANFLSRTTAWLAFVFFSVSLALAYMVNNRAADSGSIVDRLEAAPVSEIAPPATPPSDAPPAPKLPE